MKKTLLILFFLALGQAGFAFSPNIVKQGKMEVTAHFTNTLVVWITNPQLCGAWEPAAGSCMARPCYDMTDCNTNACDPNAPNVTYEIVCPNLP